MRRQVLLSAFAATLAAGTVFAQTPDTSAPAPAVAKQPHHPEEGLRKADTNNDGKVSFDELKAQRPQLTQERFSAMDKNGDGLLGPEDRIDAKGARGGKTRTEADPEARRKMLQALMATDANGDGKVSYDEVTAAKPGFAKTDFDRMDRNKDGFISADDSPKTPAATDRPKMPAAQVAKAKGLTPEQRAQLRERMKQADTDHDGYLTREEARVGLPNLTDERFKAMDKDGDGKIGPGDRPAKPAAQ